MDDLAVAGDDHLAPSCRTHRMVVPCHWIGSLELIGVWAFGRKTVGKPYRSSLRYVGGTVNRFKTMCPGAAL